MRVLLVKTSSLGDVIHNLPVATDIARALPGTLIDWCVEEDFAGIPALHPAVAGVIPVALRRWRRQLRQGHSWREIGAFRRQLGAARYDLIIDTQGLLKSALIGRAASGPRAGFDRRSIREALAACTYDRTYAVDRTLHAVTRNRQLAAQALGYRLDALPLDYGLRPLSAAHDWLPAGPYAVCLTATSRDDKCWPEADWQQLMATLAARGLHAVLPAGSLRERERAGRLAATGNATVAPALDLAALAGLLAGARLTVGVDTGLTHLAAAVGTPTIALYRASDPGLTGALGAGFCRNLGRREQAPPPAAVIAAVDEALAPAGSP